MGNRAPAAPTAVLQRPSAAAIKEASKGEWQVTDIVWEEPEPMRDPIGIRVFAARRARGDPDPFPVAVKAGCRDIVDDDSYAMQKIDRAAYAHRGVVRHADGVWRGVVSEVSFVAMERFEATLRDVRLATAAEDAGGAGGAGGDGIRVTMSQLKDIACRLLDALRFLHTECGIIHFDVCPDNIGLRSSASPTDVALFDFNCHQFVPEPWRVGPYTQRERDATRVSYASVTTLTGGPVHPADDVEQLAYTMLRVARGALPWSGGDTRAVLREKLALLDTLKRDSSLRWLHDFLAAVRALDRTQYALPYDDLLRALRGETDVSM